MTSWQDSNHEDFETEEELQEVTLKLTDTQLSQLKRLLSLPPDKFDELISLVSEPDDGIRRYSNITTPTTIRRIIKECAYLGEVIWWDCVPVAIGVKIIDPTTNTVQEAQQTVLQLHLGMPGILLGPENYAYSVLITDAIPNQLKLKGAIAQVLDSLRAAKNRQANGTAYGREIPPA